MNGYTLARNNWRYTIFIAFFFLLAATAILFYIPRTNFHQLLMTYTIWFICYIGLIKSIGWTNEKGFRILIVLAVTARILATISLPEWSDDVFRYLWDGQLWFAGLNPFDATPTEWMDSGVLPNNGNWSDLYPLLNSREYQTIYPPVHQLIFYFSTIISRGDTMFTIYIIKVIVLVAELSNLALLFQLGKEKGLHRSAVVWYALNPLVIVEGCGNLHLEVIMITFLLLAIRALQKRKLIMGSLSITGAVLTKLHPLILLPFVFKGFGRKTGALVFVATGLFVAGAFTIMWWPVEQIPIRAMHMLDSVQLYFTRFEFNGGIYYLFRAVGTQLVGYNPIHIIGKLLLIFTVIGWGMILRNQKKGIRSFVQSIALVYFMYYLLSTTVHPWYILTMLPFALLTGFITPVVWTAVIIFSYSAYGAEMWHENFYLLTLEYTCIFASLFYELKMRRHSLQST